MAEEKLENSLPINSDDKCYSLDRLNHSGIMHGRLESSCRLPRNQKLLRTL